MQPTSTEIKPSYRVLLLGGGGREHALATALSRSPHCSALFVAPGNPGTAIIATNLDLLPSNAEAVSLAIHQKHIDLVVCGPEEPLVNGLADRLRDEFGHKALLFFGPGASGARLEGSKDFSKQFMARHGIPTARYRTFTAAQLQEGLEYLGNHPLPVVLKADGLAAGKGVVICNTSEEACETLTDMLINLRFGTAGARVVVEEFLSGIEMSAFVITDGRDYLLLPEAKDYKRVGEGDTGPNTGGMGAVSPVPFADTAFMARVEERIIRRTLMGLQAENIPYTGFVFFGLMKVVDDPYVIEYNVRMGDPETEVVVPRIQSDLLRHLVAACLGKLDAERVATDTRTACTVMLVSGGYPGDYPRGLPIYGDTHRPFTYHAGTRLTAEGALQTAGGRVLAVGAMGEDLAEARARAYERVQGFCFEGVYYRHDIGLDLLTP
jgi:phosphoribosylamine--glycine ligase